MERVCLSLHQHKLRLFGGGTGWFLTGSFMCLLSTLPVAGTSTWTGLKFFHGPFPMAPWLSTMSWLVPKKVNESYFALCDLALVIMVLPILRKGSTDHKGQCLPLRKADRMRLHGCSTVWKIPSAQRDSTQLAICEFRVLISQVCISYLCASTWQRVTVGAGASFVRGLKRMTGQMQWCILPLLAHQQSPDLHLNNLQSALPKRVCSVETDCIKSPEPFVSSWA